MQGQLDATGGFMPRSIIPFGLGPSSMLKAPSFRCVPILPAFVNWFDAFTDLTGLRVITVLQLDHLAKQPHRKWLNEQEKK